MLKRRLGVIFSIIMLAGLLLLLSACSDEDGCTSSDSRKRTLQDYVMEVNTNIVNRLCCRCMTVSPEQLKTCLFDFYVFQDTYSGKKLCEIDEVEYFYPKFIMEWENRDLPVTESTVYVLTPLGPDENGVYRGIKVTPYSNDTDKKKDEMNRLLANHGRFTRNKNVIDEMLAEYAVFREKYSGSLLTEDPYLGKIYCPEYILDNEGPDYPASLEEYNYILEWRVDILGKNDDGLLTGIKVVNYPIVVPADYKATTGELIHLTLEQRIRNSQKAGEIVEGSTYTIPNVKVDLDP